ncbi:hypothetical protein SAMN06265182_0866 [Persephonella hydrogeniphila]|uniref:YgjP-like metallopeptidase domain-containing protein n=1 Tax=Persephonella hydrogeniphila TaxID=198703 RepID=A0A285NBW0_9AQUI|nr:SprT family zinc-dependent metalloprotease [Persephonella hydrogeniphila]SNZ06984.1 hypothetical protein SAMN06265182_0866 [Persephonella hydrogeniphila]
MKIKPIVQFSKRRKNIAIQVSNDGEIIVKAPSGVSDNLIDKVLDKHKNWIEKKLYEINQRDPKFLKRKFINGEGFLYLGKWYRLEIVKNQKEPLVLKDFFYLSEEYKENAKDVFISWYKKQAKKVIAERVNFYSTQTGLKPNSVKITDAQKRLGSCSSKGNLNFSWRLVMLPIRVIDYVVVHELAHLEYHNHSKNFWIKVKTIMPDYEKHKNWLKENAYVMDIF